MFENFIQLYNGVNQTANQMITVITQDTLSMNENYLANKHYTFITSPIHDEFSVYVHTSSVSDDKFIKHEIDTCEFHHNQEGGLRITSIGEFGPDIHLSNLRLEENGLVMLNLTGPSAIELYLTNSRNLVIQNSYIAKHSGDIINMVLLANQLTNGIQANLTNNVIVRNKLGSVLQAHGNHFNAIQVLRNYIAHNDCGYRTMIHINGLLSQPFANNFIYDNRADILLKCEGNENLNQYSIYQKNGFYNNQALNITKRTTIFCKNSKNIFRYNYFRNILNDYELVTGNQSIISVLPIQSGFQCPTSPYTSCPQGWKLRLEYDACICYRPDQIDAQYNWWGDTSSSSSSSSSSLPTASSLSNNQLLLMNSVKSTNITIHNENHNQITSQNFAQNRIYDHQDDLYLIKVNYANSYLTSQDRTDWLGKKLGEWQHNYDWINRYTWVTRAWVDSDAQFPTHCTVIRNGWLEPYPCNKKIGFFCQKNSKLNTFSDPEFLLDCCEILFHNSYSSFSYLSR
ncbi:unnamed protein product [Schistosoma mattheei]|uniref:Uncharacterized protein n=1 Tax=Schistosoma mattheei TaxID=31246 RepID=A0A183P365_9TREM|nr:unnamed protein product [Schistosoma mattheei]